MADVKLTGLTENTAPATTDILYLVDDPGGSPLSQKITVANLLGGIAGNVVFNESGGDYDFRVESNGNANMLVVDGGNDVVSIGAAAVAADATTYGRLQITSAGDYEALSLHNDTSGSGLTLTNTVAASATSGSVVALHGAVTPGAADIKLGSLTCRGITTGTTYKPAAQINMWSAEAWDATHSGGYLMIQTTALAAVALSEVARFACAEICFNEQSADQDFRVESNGNANAIFVDAGNDKVGICDGAPGEVLDVTGNINTTGVLKVDDVQVVSNRVIDARCDDVCNSGDATTDGVIDALRDAMIAHGLIAAA